MKKISPKYLVDLDYVSNGEGKKVYGNKLVAYAFHEVAAQDWFKQFSEKVHEAMGKKYLPVYRMADGEFRFLFGYKINYRHKPVKNLLKYIKYNIFNIGWKTSWGEYYNPRNNLFLKSILINCIHNISSNGVLALYWNENGLNAFSEYNHKIVDLFGKIGVEIQSNNYFPFHFVPALITHKSNIFIANKKILIVSSLDPKEIEMLSKNLYLLGAKDICFIECPATASLEHDYTTIQFNGDIVYVAAGVGAAKVLNDLSHLTCPIIDIGSYIHVLSGKFNNAHAGFFTFPK